MDVSVMECKYIFARELVSEFEMLSERELTQGLEIQEEEKTPPNSEQLR